MNFKNILNENLDGMMNDIKNMKLSTHDALSIQPKQANNQPQNISPQNIKPSVKIFMDPKTNQYKITDGTGKVLATINSKNDFAAIIDTLKSYAN
jgi:hypothetical protein